LLTRDDRARPRRGLALRRVLLHAPTAHTRHGRSLARATSYFSASMACRQAFWSRAVARVSRGLCSA
jgi:hypothetical protein